MSEQWVYKQAEKRAIQLILTPDLRLPVQEIKLVNIYGEEELHVGSLQQCNNGLRLFWGFSQEKKLPMVRLERSNPILNLRAILTFEDLGNEGLDTLQIRFENKILGLCFDIKGDTQQLTATYLDLDQKSQNKRITKSNQLSDTPFAGLQVEKLVEWSHRTPERLVRWLEYSKLKQPTMEVVVESLNSAFSINK